jgi:hypothetical protein
MKHLRCRGILIFAVLISFLLAACGGGGGGGDDADAQGDVITPSTVDFAIGGLRTDLGQTPLGIDLTPPAARIAIAAVYTPAADFSDESFHYPVGPDTAGDALPKITGTYDTLTGVYDGGLNSKLWINLPASAGNYQVSLQVSQVLRSMQSFAGGELTAGEIVIAPRQSYPDFAGRLRLRFSVSATPVCIGWDSDANGSYESEQCLTLDAFNALWAAPRQELPIPLAAQRAAAAAYYGWRMFYERFDFSVGALGIAETYFDALGAAPAGTTAVTVPCAIYPPTGTAGSYSIGWVDRNGSGRLDNGDDIRFDAGECWLPMEGEQDSGAGQIVDGRFELRGYERNIGAAPTFVELYIAETSEVGGVVTPGATQLVDGGYYLRAPGITAGGSDELEGYHFTPDNLVAAASVAAASMDFYPDVGDLAYNAMAAVRTSTATPQSLALCTNGGTSRLTFTEGPSPPHAAGLSEADTVTLTLVNCDMGTVENPKIMDGSLRLTIWGVTLEPEPDWSMVANARIDLQTATRRGSIQRSGEFGIAVSYVLGHSYEINFQPESHTNSETLGGVLTAIENGRLAYQIGCFGVNYYRGTWDQSDYQLLPNGVVKANNRVLTIGVRMGEVFNFKHMQENVYPDQAIAGLMSISAPECIALGVPATGVSGGETRIEFDTWPADDGDRIALRLYDRDNSLLDDVVTSWAELRN